jgi:hypothetical protein
MSTFAEQKSQLAKLMATENIKVEHRKIHTAGFNPQTRTLYLPIWQDMQGSLYDLLCGHEVGHALYTPAEGWHDATVNENKGRGYKSFLNVVEDARIEKKVKRRYPGLRNSFITAYKDLFARDFFGIRNRDVNTMPFIDRLNMFTKSQYTATWIKFSAFEETLLRKVENLETWEDVLAVTEEIYNYSKEEAQTDIQYDSSEYGEEEDDQEDDYDTDYDDDSYDEEEDEELEDGKDSKGKKGEQGEADNKQEQLDRHKDTEDAQDTYNNGPRCQTDENFRRNETQLLDEKCKDYVYLKFPKPIMENIITPYKRVHELMDKDFREQILKYQNINENSVKEWVTDFKQKNDKYIGLLAKEFEMRKAAKSFAKAKISDTGDLDLNKLATFKFDDNIFRKVMTVPKGKKHGLVLLLDKSGSMSDNMAGSIEQILVLAMFCRKVNIPFVVYGFGNAVDPYLLDRNLKDPTESQMISFVKEEGALGFSNVRLREYLNSSMSNSSFSGAVRNLIMLKKAFETNQQRHCGSDRVYIPASEGLSNTPMIEAIVAAKEVMKDFKSKNNLDLTSLVLVHDGDADWISYHYGYKTIVDQQTQQEKIVLTSQGIQDFDYNYVLQDEKTGFQKSCAKKNISKSFRDMLVQNTLEWFKETTGSKVFGFFLVSKPTYASGAVSSYYANDKGQLINETSTDYFYVKSKVNEKIKELKKEKFLHSHLPGFNSFFIVLGGKDLNTEEDEIEVAGKFTASKLKSAFMKYNQKKAVNRVLVSRFVQGIAA